MIDPLLEVAERELRSAIDNPVVTPDGRIAYGPVQPEDLSHLLAANFLEGKPHPLRLGPIEEIPYFRNQERLNSIINSAQPNEKIDEAETAVKGLEAKLADPKWKGRVCIRSGQHPYNTAMIAALWAAIQVFSSSRMTAAFAPSDK